MNHIICANIFFVNVCQFKNVKQSKIFKKSKKFYYFFFERLMS